MILYMVGTVGLGEILAVGVLGNVLLITLERYKSIIFGGPVHSARS